MSDYYFDPGMIACDLGIPSEYYTDIVEAMKEYGRLVRDLTLEWAAENVGIVQVWGDWYPDKDSILEGKTSKDLEI